MEFDVVNDSKTEAELAAEAQEDRGCNLFCEVCGDCLRCYGEDGCNGEDGVSHVWPSMADRGVEWTVQS